MTNIFLRNYQLDAIDNLTTVAAEGKRRLLLQAPTGSGKCLGRGTPVLKFNGDIVPVEAICQGDLLMGPDSNSRKVYSISYGVDKLFKIIPIKGNPWICNKDHILTLIRIDNDKIIDVPLVDYNKWSKTKQNLHKQFFTKVDFASTNIIPIDPYFLGLWYGDGTKRLTGVAISKPDLEVLETIKNIATQYGLSVRTDYGHGSCPTHHLTKGMQQKTKNSLLEDLRRVVGDLSSIPRDYLTASKHDRLELLAGLLDTDGYYAKGGYEIVQKRQGIAAGICFLSRSLGLRATMSIKIVNGDTYYRIYISGQCHIIPTRIPRKKATIRKQIKNATRTGFSIIPIGTGEYFGFTLDGDGRFLLGDFTVTHNTIIASKIISHATSNGQKVLFLTHRREILWQTEDKLNSFGVPCGIIMAGEPWDPTRLVNVASLQTLHSWCFRRKRADFPKADLIVADEIQHGMSKTWQEILSAFPEALVLGMTATPCNRSGKGLGNFFEAMIKCPSISELTEQGYLVPARYFVPSEVDLKGLKLSQGDYIESELDSRFNIPKLVGDIVLNWSKYGENRQTLVFASGVKHSINICDEFNKLNIKASHIDGSTDKKLRDQAMKDFSEGKIKVLCNCQVFTEGVDIPSASCLVFARPTKSLMLYLQVAGRVIRTFPGKLNAIILDHGGVVHEHGPIAQEWDWKLDYGKGTVRMATEKKTKLKREMNCEKCKCVYYGKLACPECGWKPTIKGRYVETYGDYLKAMDEIEQPKVDEKMWYRMLLGYCREHNKKDGFAFFKFQERYDYKPKWSWKQLEPVSPSLEVLAWIRKKQIEFFRNQSYYANNKVNTGLNIFSS